MANKIPPCHSQNGRHTWAFVGNRTLRRETLSYVELTVKGRFKCETCGRIKYGMAQYREAELAHG